MYIERVQIEEGFLDGLDIALVPGLNVVIGARGTGKTSLIELIRFCLHIPGHTRETERRSEEHALSVLGAGQVTVTLSDSPGKITATRTAAEDVQRASGAFRPPIIFSQTEIESVGLQADGRLRLLDSFLAESERTEVEEAGVRAEVQSISAEAETLRREIDQLRAQLEALPSVEQLLKDVSGAEERLGKTSVAAAEKKKLLDRVSVVISSAGVALTTVTRFRQTLSRLRPSISAGTGTLATFDVWPPSAGNDVLVGARERIQRAQEHFAEAMRELEAADAEALAEFELKNEEKLTFEERARTLRKEIDGLEAGAGAVTRQGQQLRERKAQLDSLGEVLKQRQQNLKRLQDRQATRLDRIASLREERFNARAEAAARLNRILGPAIRIEVLRAGQFDVFAEAISTVLKGSGLRYAELSIDLASKISPRELVEITDADDFELLAELAGITKDRAARVIAQLRETNLGSLATVLVDDSVEFQLLDGQDYKDFAKLSTGQRCSVILPLVLTDAGRVLIVDQPEDHIDNAFITGTLLKALKARGSSSQVIFSTHNANIPVLGGAERVIHLGSDGRRGFVLTASELEDPSVVEAISNVMEGGAEAFKRRADFYNRHVEDE
jgi:hypothetical protein